MRCGRADERNLNPKKEFHVRTKTKNDTEQLELFEEKQAPPTPIWSRLPARSKERLVELLGRVVGRRIEASPDGDSRRER